MLEEHRAPTVATRRLFSGRMVLRGRDCALDLGPGGVVTMEAGLAHSAEARAGSASLLALAADGAR